jgi:peptidoglycan DL-endopeptidase CwlO
MAFRQAGVSLPHSSRAQINYGRRVSRQQLQPGDLVFFYSPITHVGIYIGNGQMVHSPRPGQRVRIAPLSIMPYVGATRL